MAAIRSFVFLVCPFCTAVILTLAAVPAQAAFVLEIDIDGADDGVLTFNPLFSLGNDTTSVSQSAAGLALGLTGGDSIFGGNGVEFPDTYVYRYSPESNPDNLLLAPGTELGEGNLATGVEGGGPGLYNVYATWPFTSNVSGGLTTYAVETTGDSFAVEINQNDVDPDGTAGRGNAWVLLGQISYTSGGILVTQQSTSNTFVSQRASGLLFEAVPEPSSAILLGFAFSALVASRRRTRE